MNLNHSPLMIRKLATGLVVVFFVTATAHGVVIDSFDTPQSLLADSGNQFVPQSVAGGGILGGERDSYVQFANGTNTVVDINAAGSGVLSFSAGALGYADFVWDGPDGSDNIDLTGLSGVDLTAANALNAVALKVALNDVPVQVGINIITDASNWSGAILNLPGGISSAQTIDVLFTAFVPHGTGADFANVNAILLYMTSDLPSINLQIDSIESVNVPEPATLTLFGSAFLMLGGIGFLKRRRRREVSVAYASQSRPATRMATMTFNGGYHA